jgi:hypothetical protein
MLSSRWPSSACPRWGTKDFMGMGRYLISAFPLFLTLALLLR